MNITNNMINVTVFFKNNSENCQRIIDELIEVKNEIPINILYINVDENQSLYSDIYENLPVVEIGPYKLVKEFSRQQLEVTIRSAIERKNQLEIEGGPKYERRVKKANKMTGTDKFSFWFSKQYMLIFNLLVLIYIGLPFLAPVMEKYEYTTPAKIIYTIYSPLCHQLAFRSFFLFGEQTYYPRDLAHIDKVITYEKLTGEKQINLVNARNFIGNDITGYKVALCERDVSIYGAILIFGLIFSVTGNKIKSFPWYVWIIFGLIPIGLDGVSQLPSLSSNFFPVWFPIRESTPLLRTITGGLFGLTTAWYLYPLIEETMLETRKIYQKKFILHQSAKNENIQ